VRTVSKQAYDTGVVLVRCKCDKLHLIADRLGWFDDGGTDVEKILVGVVSPVLIEVFNAD